MKEKGFWKKGSEATLFLLGLLCTGALVGAVVWEVQVILTNVNVALNPPQFEKESVLFEIEQARTLFSTVPPLPQSEVTSSAASTP